MLWGDGGRFVSWLGQDNVGIAEGHREGYITLRLFFLLVLAFFTVLLGPLFLLATVVERSIHEVHLRIREGLDAQSLEIESCL